MENGYCVNPALDSSDLEGSGADRPEDEKEEEGMRVEESTETILSLVLNPRVTSANACKKATLSRWRDVILLISILYALILILLGFTFPVAEAYGAGWFNEPFTGVFYIYLFVVGTVYLLYMQYFLEKDKHKGSTGNKLMSNNLYSTGYITKSAPVNLDHNAPPSFSSQRRHSNFSLQLLSNKDEKMEDIRGPSGTPGVFSTSQGYLGTRHKSANGVIGGGISPWKPNSMKNDGNGNNGSELIPLDGFSGMFEHEGTSFYIRIGTLMFAVGYIVYISLEMEHYYGCQSRDPPVMTCVLIFQMIFVLVQTFFIFKNPVVNLNCDCPKWIAASGFMHLMATNICVWSRTLIYQMLYRPGHPVPPPVPPPTYDPSVSVVPMMIANASTSTPLNCGGNDLDPYHCNSVLAKTASPYLFPFVLEYSLVAMATAAVMYDDVKADGYQLVIRNIHHLIGNNNTQPVMGNEPNDHTDWRDTNPTKSPKHHGSLLQKSHTGIFFGVILMVVVFFSLIIFFSSPNTDDTGQIVYLSTDIGLHVALIMAAILALVKIRKMGYSKKIFSIDDLLILISMSGSLLFQFTILLSVVDKAHKHSPFNIDVVALTLTSSLTALVQNFTQVVCILVGLRTRPANEKQAQEMEGRGTLAFMILVNVAVWILGSIRSKELSMGTSSYLYPDGLWTIATCIFLPLLLFFHFYSSACLADVWAMAYKPLQQKCPPTPTNEKPVTHL